MIYEVIIKSHCEAPDYEDSVEAESKAEAIAKLLQKSSLRDWGYKDLEPFVGVDEEVSKKKKGTGYRVQERDEPYEGNVAPKKNLVVGVDEEVSKKNVKKVVETYFKQLNHLNKLMRKHYGKMRIKERLNNLGK
jgi:hypothetical protein